MGSKRTLPSGHNPLLSEGQTPPYNVLVERRLLGQTDLSVKSGGSVGAQHLTKDKSHGIFEYAHLRVPLPKDLKGSGIFHALSTGGFPESYFLMRRSSDGYISATGMFKAAYPWASSNEEQAERKYHKSIPSAGSAEVAGNVWIAPEHALELAQEYAMRPWIVALLSPEAIKMPTKDKVVGEISTPPRFDMSEQDRLFPPPTITASSARTRTLRSASPAKASPTPRKIASPRKRLPRGANAKAEAKKDLDKAAAKDAEKASKEAQKAGRSLQRQVEPPAAAPASAKAKHAPGKSDDLVRVAVDQVVEKVDDVERQKTTVTIDVPASHPEIPPPESTEEVIATARQMVEQASKLEASRLKSTKRKADDMEPAESEVPSLNGEGPAAKRAKGELEDQLSQERVKSRALIGLTATLAIGAVIPYFL